MPMASAPVAVAVKSPLNSPCDLTLKSTIQWITLPLSSIHMLLFLMFAARRRPRERHFPEWRVQFSEPSPKGIRAPLTLLHSVSCRLLALFLMAPSFVFSNLQPLLPKRGGIGGCVSVWKSSSLLTLCLHNVCFHNVTNPSSRNPFLFTSIQIPRGVLLP